MQATDHDSTMIHQRAGDVQAEIRDRLEQIWSAAAARDFDLLESFHRYGPGFTAFKDGRPRGDAHSCAAGERALFAMMDAPAVDMRDLAVNVIGPVAIVTFNGHFTGAMHGTDVALDMQTTLVFSEDTDGWRVVHEHMSPLTYEGAGPTG